MTLDAYVYCNCVETGNLLTPHPFPARLSISQEGYPALASDDIEELMLHDRWQLSFACPHQDCILVHHFLGNIARIGLMRDIVAQLVDHVEDRCPILWSNVIYNGTHCGDYLTPEQVSKLDAEMRFLRSCNLTGLSAEHAHSFQDFLGKLEDLIRASQQVNKPIVF